jgi:hypothetical protein
MTEPTPAQRDAKEFASDLSIDVTTLIMERLEQRYPNDADVPMAIFAGAQVIAMTGARSILALTGTQQHQIASEILKGVGMILQDRLKDLLEALAEDRKGEWCAKCRDWH